MFRFRSLRLAIFGLCCMHFVTVARAQVDIINWSTFPSNSNIGFNTITATEQTGSSERVNNYIFTDPSTPLVDPNDPAYVKPNALFGIMQFGHEELTAPAPTLTRAIVHSGASELRIGSSPNPIAPKNETTLIYFAEDDSGAAISSLGIGVSDLFSASLTTRLRGEDDEATPAVLSSDVRLAVRNAGQWYLSSTSLTDTATPAFPATPLAITDFTSEMWGAFNPATAASDAVVTTSGLSFTTASASLNNVEALGYFSQILNNEYTSAPTRLDSGAMLWQLNAPATQYVTELSIGSNGQLAGTGVSINSVNTPGATLTRTAGSNLDAANMSSNETWSFTLSDVDLDGDGSADDSLSFDLGLASTFTSGGGEPDRYLHDRTSLPQGDFNNDNAIDGADFLLWQRGGSPNPTTPEDLADWQGGYGDPVVATDGGGFSVEPSDVGSNEGGLSENETLQFVASNLTYSIDGGADQNDGTINGFVSIEMANSLNQDNVQVEGTNYGLAGSPVINLLTADEDITVQFAPGTIPIGGMNPQMVEKTQDFSIGNVRLRVTIPAGVAATGAVPEPSSIGLALLGLSALTMRRRVA